VDRAVESVSPCIEDIGHEVATGGFAFEGFLDMLDGLSDVVTIG
jgi:hypothetical protein